MVGSLVAVAAPAAHAATILPDFCGVYLQGTVDPAGGLIPAGDIPFPVTGNTVGQKSYVLVGHESKGQGTIVNDLNNTTAGATRFKIGVTVGGTITGNTAATGPVAPVLGNPVGSTSSVGIQWKNDANGLGPKMILVQASEKNTLGTQKISKGFVTEAGSADRLGAQIGTLTAGNNGTGPGPIAGVPGPASSSSFGLFIPPAATAGTFKLSMKFPAIAGPPVGGNTYHSGNINVVGLTPAIIATSLNTPVAPPPPPDGGTFGNLGGGVSVVAGPRPGTYVISFAATALANQSLPSLSALAADQTGALATTVADDGALRNAWRNGGPDAGLSPVTDLGQGIFTSSGVMASGNIPAFATNPTGKWFITPDTQYLFLQYPAGLVSALVPNLATDFAAQGLLQAIVGANLTVTLDPCGLVGILGLFCTAAGASIPPAFLGICGLL